MTFGVELGVMFMNQTGPYREENESKISANALIAAIPIILFIAFICGTYAFFSSQKPTGEKTERHAKLPVAGDRLIAFEQYQNALAKPLVAYAAKVTNPLAAVKTTEQGNWIRIPSLKVNVPVSESPSMDDDDVLQTLAKGVAMYPNGIRPGENGNVFVAGHSTGEPWKGPYRFAFMNVSKLKQGDTILVDYNNSRYTYTVTGSRVIDPKDTHFIESKGDKPTLSLMACWPLWTAKNRMIIESKLVAINPLVIINK